MFPLYNKENNNAGEKKGKGVKRSLPGKYVKKEERE